MCGSQKRGLKNSPEPYHAVAVGNDENECWYKIFWNNVKKLSYNVKVKFLFWFLDGVDVIFILSWKPMQRGKINYACFSKQKKLTCYCCDFTFVINLLIRNSKISNRNL